MGSLKKFSAWLGGDKNSFKSRGNNVRSAITQMKIFNKRLARQIKRMEAQGRQARKKAIERRTAGDIPGSRLHMKSYLQFQKWSNATENFRVRIEGVQFKLEQAKAMQDFSNVATDISKVLGQMQLQVQSPKINELLEKLDLGFGSMDEIFGETNTKLESMDDASTTGVSEAEVDEALGEIDAEMSIGTREALPSVPGMKDDDEIIDLEAEIAKLKSQRNN